MKPVLEAFLRDHYQSLLDDFVAFCSQSNNQQHAHDILHDVLMYVNSKYSEDYLKGLHERRQLRYFIWSIMQMQIKSNRSDGYKHYRKLLNWTYDDETLAYLTQNIEDEGPNIEREQQIDEVISQLTDIVSNLFMYKLTGQEKSIFLQYTVKGLTQSHIAFINEVNYSFVKNKIKHINTLINEQMRQFYPEFNIVGHLPKLKIVLENLDI